MRRENINIHFHSEFFLLNKKIPRRKKAETFNNIIHIRLMLIMTVISRENV